MENIQADRNDAAACAKPLSTRRFDVVFDNVYDWERGTTAGQVEATVAACGDRLSRYIFLSSVAAYGDGLNHKESDPLAPDYHANPYVRHKATTERLLFRMQAQTGLPLVTFRPPFVYGPGNPFYREQFFWDRLRAGRPIIIPGDGHRLMQFVYVNDLVLSMVRSMEEPRAVGEAFNIGDPKPITQVEFAEKLARSRQHGGHARASAARRHPAGRRQRHGRAVLFRRIPRCPADHRKYRKSGKGA